MDREHLLKTLASTLVPAQSKAAELELAQLERQPGFAPALLETIFSAADLGVARASAVYLKNKVTRAWTPVGVDPLNQADRDFLKTNIVSSIVKAPPALREFFLVSLSAMLTSEFKNDTWPQLLPQVMQLLQNPQNLDGVAAGLAILKQVCKFYRWQNYSNNKKLTPLMAHFFPQCLEIAEASMNAARTDEQDIYFQLVYEVLKIYKLATSRYLPDVFREEECAKRTVSLFVNVFMHDARNKNLFYPEKCQKWATANIVRTYSAYLTKSYIQLSENGAAYSAYRNLFVTLFAPEIARLYVEQLQLWSQSRRELTPAVLCHVITFLTAVVDLKSIYAAQIEPHLQGLVEHVVFRLLTPTEDDQDLFEDDPVEFIHRNMSFGERALSPFADAGMLVYKLARKRKATLPLFLQFLESKAASLQQIAIDASSVPSRVGVLSLLQALAPLLTAKPATDLEPFVQQVVLPAMVSSHAYLRTAACETAAKLAALEYAQPATLQSLFTSLLDSFMNTKCLPLQVSSALALQALSMAPQNEDLRAALGLHISDIIATLLNLTQIVDSEQLLGVLDYFVDLYPDQITPFAIDLAQHLCTQFVNLAGELGDETEFIAQDDKINTGLNIMNSLCNLQSALEHRPDLTAQLDAVIAPIFAKVYLQKMVDFYPDCMTLHENTLFSMKQIPDRQWEFFDLLIAMLQQDEIDYFEEVMPVMENYIMYGSQSLAANPQRLGAFTGLLVSLYAPRPHEQVQEEHTLSAAYGAARTRGHVLALLVKLLTCNELVKGPMVAYIPDIVRTVSDRVVLDAQTGISIPPRYNVALVSVVLACIFNEPGVTLSVLDQSQSTPSFFEMWFNTASEFVRLTDYKLEEMAVLTLLVSSTANQTVANTLPQLLHLLCTTLVAMPEAVRKIEEMLKAEEASWDDNYDEDGFLDEQDDDDEPVSVSQPALEAQTPAGDGSFVYENPGPADDTKSETDAPVDIAFLSDDFDEHLYAMNPLDKLNPYNALRMAWSSLGDAAQQLVSLMSDADKRVLEQSMQIEALVDPKETRK